ncbi:DUF397 domain-containing protein [Actinomadura graeca]|uniref:DUF397 domain-containing protein n=1 Tax=Actinomadura graeca TaxID=2750812 RepID=A0ABX8QY07_9ACTN|nr:DUF397 domain-containing protein [Actinomadura graeca]
MGFDVTPPARWRRSARCGASNGCVEIARPGAGVIFVRDSTHIGEDTPIRLVFDVGEWRRFADDAKGGRFDRP